MILGLSGYARSGKDSVAEILVNEGWTRIAFADKLRDFLYALNPAVRLNSDYTLMAFADRKGELPSVADVHFVIDIYGWNGYKNSPYSRQVREYLQRLGTEAGRQVLSDNVWVDAALQNLSVHKNYVITDCRFTNEAESLEKLGGNVYRVNRRGVGPANDHISETGLDDYDFAGYIENNGTLQDLHEEVFSRFCS